MRNLVSRVLVLLLVAPFLLATACSDDDDTPSSASTSSTTSVATTAQEQTGTTTQTSTTSAEATSGDAISGSVKVDFTGAPEELEAIDMEFEVEAGSTAWEAIKAALGEENVSFQDFGGDLGVFITGFNGVDAEGNNFWEFKPNGETAEVGVSKYEVQQGDVLEFAYSSF